MGLKIKSLATSNFEIVVDKADKESKLDGETKMFVMVIKEREKGIDKRRLAMNQVH